MNQDNLIVFISLETIFTPQVQCTPAAGNGVIGAVSPAAAWASFIPVFTSILGRTWRSCAVENQMILRLKHLWIPVAVAANWFLAWKLLPEAASRPTCPVWILWPFGSHWSCCLLFSKSSIAMFVFEKGTYAWVVMMAKNGWSNTLSLWINSIATGGPRPQKHHIHLTSFDTEWIYFAVFSLPLRGMFLPW